MAIGPSGRVYPCPHCGYKVRIAEGYCDNCRQNIAVHPLHRVYELTIGTPRYQAD